MSGVTLRVLDGADRGRVFAELNTPITIGREEGNTIQLNDERVSRFHLKIQEDNERLVLTDLESTNGTKVNGEDIQLKILRFGDLISVGRSVLLFGTREQIVGRMSHLRGNEEFVKRGTNSPNKDDRPSVQGSSVDFDLNFPMTPEGQAKLMLMEPPELPDRMTPGQAAQIAEMLEYLIIRLRELIASVRVENNKAERVSLEFGQWQYLVDVQARLGEMLRSLSEPDRE